MLRIICAIQMLCRKHVLGHAGCTARTQHHEIDPTDQEFIYLPCLADVDGELSVSYTHLRAHETDSYLVCRLLLEKKK